MRTLPSWVDYRGPVPHSTMPDFMNACDVLVVPYRRGSTMDMGASCKIAEYLLCDRPLAATNTPNFTSNFPEQAAELGDGLCRPGDPVDLARAIRLQLEAPRLVSRPERLAWGTIALDTFAALERIAGTNQGRGLHLK
jgi:glycosyltransferase involved in cell wall biosynthesis